MDGYTVIDVETTGFSPQQNDRVVEIGVVYVSPRGEIQDHWSTIVNPRRDVGPTHVHGLTATDVSTAPTFDEIAPYVLRALTGRVVVAHNASFDLRFVASELVRAGIALEQLPLDGICTMQWSPAFLNATSRRLADCCRAGGISLVNAHSAIDDALATAALLGHYLDLAQYDPPWTDTLAACTAYPWPTFPGSYPELRMTRRHEVRSARQDEWLDRIVSRMPRAADPRVDSYLAVLETAMFDRFLAEHEKEALVAVALDSGLSRGQVLDLHGDYLLAMAAVALEDHVVTPEERGDLESVASMLGLRSTDVDEALRAAHEDAVASQAAAVSVSSSGIVLEPGDRVVFTGDMVREREEWESIARGHGLDPGGVTKKTKVVVAADPNSLSGKGRKARSYGVPIVTEAAFERLMSESFAA
ncbi:DNA polymerase III subunit epsilon [Phycicoccus sp. BSK3Z-2]|uniref:DNA polymerase III subunit epsilon n=1 Tax=Phycicoccus avicenniae TaxID=2828860 RepID=A0A941I0X5_9MICO|nr:exonuclease domain-containing protein [Phycicoccus avicenniae]MBR7744365.1 DNA polymerase III subunit epsilon [Phycicoccus avicenniae]